MTTVSKPRDPASLQKALETDFRRPALLEQALVHRSYLNEAPELDLESNERMEFLGDAVLGLVISERLYGDYPALSEGHLSQIRALLVRWDTLAEAAERISLGDYLILGRGEEMSGGRTRPPNLAGGLGGEAGRLIRARKREDAIFAGSSKRQRADKAEVALTLDNSDGWLPLDFSEVALSRRGYRNGESDYMITRKRVRLRDIQELLAKASFAQSSYAIIGQGVCGRAPHENVERIRLLVKEIAPRLGQLERQAKRAADYTRISRELSQALRAYYGHQWHHAHESVAVSRDTHDQAQAA